MSAYLEAFAAALDRVYASLTAPGASLSRDAAETPEVGSGSLAGTGVVVHLDNHSRKVADDDFNPNGYPINRRTTPAHDTGGYAPDDPKGWAA